MYHPDIILQIAKHQQKEYFKIAEKARLARKISEPRSNNPGPIQAVLGWIGDRLSQLSHRSRIVSRELSIAQPNTCLTPDCPCC